MKQFYVDTQGNRFIKDAIIAAARDAGLLVSESLRECDYRQIILRFLDGEPDLTANWKIESGWGEQYTIDQALTYFRELKEEREKPVYKVDDWVVLTNERPLHWSARGSMDKFLGSVQQIKVINERSIRFANSETDEWGFLLGDIKRLATPAEISAAQKIFIGGYEVKFLRTGFGGCIGEISVGGKKFNANDTMSLYMYATRLEVKALIFHDCNGKEIKVDFETVQKITERLK